MSLDPKPRLATDTAGTFVYSDGGPWVYVRDGSAGVQNAAPNREALLEKRVRDLEQSLTDLAGRAKRLEAAGDRLDSHIACGCGVDGPCRSCSEALDGWRQAKEATP